jgi:hypothetical protein
MAAKASFTLVFMSPANYNVFKWTYCEVFISKHLSVAFPIKNGFKQETI